MFVSSGVGLFMMKLNTGKLKKVGKSGVYYSVLPYTSFCTLGMILALAWLLSCIFFYSLQLMYVCLFITPSVPKYLSF